MAEYSAPATLVTPGPTITFNAASGNTLYLDPEMCSGLDGGPIRRTIEDAPMTDGALVFPSRKGGRHIVIGGWVHVTTGATESDYRTNREALVDNLRLALESIENADGTYTWTPIGGARALTVQADIPVTTNGAFQKKFVFGLIAADPTW